MEALTQLIYEFESSLGSRLHIKSKDEYIAYAQWQSKNTFETSSLNLPKKANEYRELIKNACLKIEILEQMGVVEDLLAKRLYDKFHFLLTTLIF